MKQSIFIIFMACIIQLQPFPLSATETAQTTTNEPSEQGEQNTTTPAEADIAEWQQLNDKTLGYYQEQKHTKAAATGRQALSAARSLPEAEKEKLATSLGNLAMIYTHLGKFADAEAFAKEELQIREQLFGKDTPQVITAWNHLAIIYTMVGKMSKINPDAEFCMLQIVTITEKANGKESLAVIPALEKLEKYYRITGNMKKEKEIAARVAALRPPAN